MTTKTIKDYPNRYYASYCKVNLHVTGWYDTHDMTLDNVPDEKDLHPLTIEEWNSRKLIGHGIKDGKLCEMEQVISVPVNKQAEQELLNIRKHITEEYLMMNEQVPDVLVEYQKKLKKVISGELKKLPKKPKY